MPVSFAKFLNPEAVAARDAEHEKQIRAREAEEDLRWEKISALIDEHPIGRPPMKR